MTDLATFTAAGYTNLKQVNGLWYGLRPENGPIYLYTGLVASTPVTAKGAISYPTLAQAIIALVGIKDVTIVDRWDAERPETD